MHGSAWQGAALVVLGLAAGCFDPSDSTGEEGPTSDGSTGGASTEASLTVASADDTTGTTVTVSDADTSLSTSSGTSDASADSGTSATPTSEDTSAGATAESTTGDDPPAHTIFLNFEGPTLSGGVADDARIDQTSIEDFDIDFQPYGDAGDEAMLLDMVAADFAAFDVLVTDVRPMAGDYTMIVVTPTNPIGAGVIGLSSGVDCGNANPNSVSFAFFSTGSEFELQMQANAISGQVGLSVGLERTIDRSQSDVMHQFADDIDREFVDLCIELRDPPVPVCLAGHEDICGAGSGRQNAVQELELIFGPA